MEFTGSTGRHLGEGWEKTVSGGEEVKGGTSEAFPGLHCLLPTICWECVRKIWFVLWEHILKGGILLFCFDLRHRSSLWILRWLAARGVPTGSKWNAEVSSVQCPLKNLLLKTSYQWIIATVGTNTATEHSGNNKQNIIQNMMNMMQTSIQVLSFKCFNCQKRERRWVNVAFNLNL